MPQTSAEQRAQHLERVRMNQRRSRARRKEYLQELETKYRACTEQGVAASTEVQEAAKKVLEENKRLRALLRQQGYSDHQIDSIPMDVADFPSVGVGHMLETVLAARRASEPSSGHSPTHPGHQPTTPTSTASSTASQPQHSQYSRYGTPTAFHQYPSPSSSVSVPISAGGAVMTATAGAKNSNLANDYRMTVDDVAWLQEQYRRVQAYPPTSGSMSDSGSCYSSAETVRGISQQISPHLDDHISEGFYGMMDRYSER